MLIYYPCAGNTPPDSFFKTVATGTKGDDRVWFCVHSKYEECQACFTGNRFVNYENIDEMRDAARALKAEGWRITAGP